MPWARLNPLGCRVAEVQRERHVRLIARRAKEIYTVGIVDDQDTGRVAYLDGECELMFESGYFFKVRPQGLEHDDFGNGSFVLLDVARKRGVFAKKLTDKILEAAYLLDKLEEK